MKILLITLFITFSLNSYSASISKKQLNYVTIDNTAEPFQIDYTGSKRKGLITDIFEEIVQALYRNQNYVTVSAPFLRAMKIMRESNQYKWVCYGAKEWSNIQGRNLSKEPLFQVNHQLVTRKGFKFKSIKDIFNKRIVLINGFAYPGLDKYIRNKKIDVLIVNSHASALRALMIGRAEAFPEIKIRAVYHIKKQKRNIKDFKFHDFSKYIKNYNFHLAFSDGMKSEIPKFDKEIKRLRKEKFIRKAISKYLR
jgi:polar amino acid transport system substrate-binding protein